MIKQPAPIQSNSQLKWVETIAHLMDNKFRLPGTNFRFGLDPIFNMVPFLGSFSGFAISAALVVTMAKNGVSGKVLTLMILNIVLDSTIGAIPILGNLFDFTYKSNTRNINLLRQHYVEGKHQGSGKNIVAIILVVMAVFFFVLMYLTWLLLKLLGSYF